MGINRVDLVSSEALDDRLLTALTEESPIGERLREIIGVALQGGIAGQSVVTLEAGIPRPNALAPSIIQRRGTVRNLVTNPRGAILGAPGSGRTNLVTNPNFEINTAGWAPVGSTTTLVRSTAQFQAGTASGLVTLGAGTGVTQAMSMQVNGLNVGRTYTFSAWIYVPSATLSAQISLWINGTASFSSPVSTAGTWVRASLSFPATATSHTLSIGNGTTSTAGMIFYVDQVLFEESATLGTYFDGDTADTAVLDYSWTGAAGSSTSTQASKTIAGYTFTVGTPTVPTGGTAPDGSKAVTTVTGAVAAAATLIEVPLTGLSPGQTYTALIRVFTPTGAPTTKATLTAGTATGNGNTVGTTKDAWAYTTVTVVANGSTGFLRLLSVGTGTGSVFAQLVLAPGLYDGPFFDGDTGPASWDGDASASPSRTYLGALSIWNGTSEAWINDTLSGIPKVNSSGQLAVSSLSISSTAAPGATNAVRRDFLDTQIAAASATLTASMTAYGRDRGAGTGALPSTDLRRGDTYMHTGVGSLMVYNGTAWRQVDTAVVAAEASLGALNVSYGFALHTGFQVRLTDTKRTYEWDGTVWNYVGGGMMPTFTLPFDPAYARSYGTGPDYTLCRYGKDANGMVHFFGLMYLVTTLTSGAYQTIVPVGGMPTGYRLAGGGAGSISADLSLTTVSGVYIGRVDAMADGSVRMVNNSGQTFNAGSFVPLTAVKYPTG